MSRCHLLLVLLGLVAAACNSGLPATAPTGDPTGYSTMLLAPMNALPSCGPPPEGDEVEPVDGLRLPEGAVLLRATEQDDLTQVFGYVPLTPVQTLAAFDDVEGIRIVQREHEVFESELLYEITEGEFHRAFVKTQVACATGSNFVAIVAGPEATQAVPTPSGGPTPTP